MGCGSSKSRAVSPKPNPKNGNKEISDMTETSTFGVNPREIEEIFDFLVSSCSTFHCPPGTIPIACLSDNSIPVVISPLTFDGSKQTGIDMPILAAGIKKKGRIVCYGHVCMFNRNYFNSGDTGVLIHNSVIWLNDKKGIINPVQFISIPREYHSEIKRCFHIHGIQVQFEEFSSDIFQDNSFVIIPSYFNIDDAEKKNAINNLISNGGGLGVVYIPKEGTDFSNTIVMNRFLIKFGLSFTYCSLSEDVSTPFTVIVHDSFDHPKKYIFWSLIEQFNHFINSNSNKTNTTFLDDLITEIRYNVLVSGKNQIQLILLLIDICWEYLKKTNYQLDNGLICPEVYHSITVTLMMDLYTKRPLECITASPEASTFPGLAYDVDIEDITVNLKLQNESIISTGIWIQPGVISKLHIADKKCISCFKNIYIQVGSHSLSLLPKPGPWKRWPSTVCTFKITSESKDEEGDQISIEFASQFGGIVYIAIASFPDEFDDVGESPASPSEENIKQQTNENVNVQCTFEKVCHYPMSVYDDKNVYIKTKSLNVPWGEIVSKSIIFTLPTKYITDISDFDSLFEHIEKIISLLSEYMKYPIVRQYRIVFDVETVDNKPVAHYPIFMLESDINDILFLRTKPSPGLFRLLMMLTLVSMRDGVFDFLTEDALSAFVASIVMKKMFPSFDPIEKPPVDMPVLFKELWLIHLKVNGKVLQNMIVKSQAADSPVYDVPEDRWIAFVRDLCFSLQLNFMPILERARPIPLNLATNLNTLKPAPAIC